MKRALIITAVAIGIILTILLAGFLYFKTTPQYMLLQLYSDYKSGGIEAIDSHLTDEAKEKLELIKTLSKNKLLNTVIDMFSGDENGFFSEIVNNPGNIKWEYKGIKKEDEKALVTLAFVISGKMSGKLDIVLVKTDDIWKLDSFDNPVFEKISLK